MPPFPPRSPRLPVRRPGTEPPLTATRFYGTNARTSAYNTKRLAEIDEPEKRFHMKTAGPERLVEWAIKHCTAEKELVLKKGALVMLLVNTTSKLANGTVGRVVGFSGDGYPLFEALADADADRSSPKRRRVEPLTVRPHDWDVVDHSVGTATLTQIPLKLAYSITIHKSQGMQLDETVLAIDTKNCFECGQAYVALSRCTSLGGLYLETFDPKAIRAHPAAVAFYEKARAARKPAAAARAARSE